MESIEAREARYAKAIMGGKERAALLTIRNPGEVANAYRDARAVIVVADAELAEARAKVSQYERDLNITGDEFDVADLRAEVERLRATVARVRALADAFADDGLQRYGGNIAWHIEEAIANEKGDFPDAADRHIASQRERAEAAEAKLRAVEAATEWRDVREFGSEHTTFSNGARKMAMKVRAVLARSQADA